MFRKCGYIPAMRAMDAARQSIGQANATNSAPKIILWHLIVGILVSIVFTVVFVKIFDFVEDNGRAAGATTFDHTIEVWVNRHQTQNPAQTAELLKVAKFLALMGSPRVIVTLAALAALIGLVWRKVRGAVWILPIAIIGAGVIIQSVKLLVHRPRPSSFTPLLHESGYSFPSGHSLIAMVVYGLLGYFALKLFKNRAARLAVRIVTILIIVSIGLSRVYVGVHYPTDVLAGWTAGVPWLLACLYLHEVLVRRWPMSGEPVLTRQSDNSGDTDSATAGVKTLLKG